MQEGLEIPATPEYGAHAGRARVPTPKTSKLALNVEDQFLKTLPNPYKIRNYYLPDEVSEHNTPDNCWVSIFNQVYDLTKLIQENSSSSLCDPIVLAAGTDITHWFNPDTREPKTFVDPVTNLKSFFCPTGRYLHIPPANANSNVDKEVAKFEIPWWNDNNRYIIGRLTQKVRTINIMNTLTKDEVNIDVATEENMNEILDRYLCQNFHAASYTWKRLGNVLDMTLNLQENGIPDESEECLSLGIDPHEYIPTVHLYFDDDLTIQ